MLNIYRASAGSGKTFQLTKDYIFLLFDAIQNNTQRPHRRVLAVTFTNKATDEMKSRILKELHLLSLGEKSEYREDLIERFSLSEQEVNEIAKKLLISILHDYSSFSISTIDKFFQQVVRSFAREIGISGGYNIELDNSLTLQQALDNFYDTLTDDTNKLSLSWMTEFLQDKISDGKSWHIDRGILKFGKEIFKENYQNKAKDVQKKLKNKALLSEYRKKLRKIKSDFEKEIENEAKNIVSVLNANGLDGSEFKSNHLVGGLNKIIKEQIYDISKYKSLESYSEHVDKCITGGDKNPNAYNITNAYNNGVGDSLKRIVELLSDGNENYINYNSANLILSNLDTLGILTDLAVQIKEITSEQNIMLISDTNLLLNQIIDDSDTPFVYERTGLNIDHYMIDEFQDTSVLQWENFKPLIKSSLSGGRNNISNYNMLVGDVKQSIYRWRNSDWKLLDNRVNNEFSEGQISSKSLDTNWRSDKNIIHFNNAFFKVAANKLQQKLNDNLESLADSNSDLHHLSKIITHAYSDIEQKAASKAKDGYVQVQFVVKEDKKADWEESVLENIPALLKDLVKRGYKPHDVAFLVREKKHAALLMNYLLEYKKSKKEKDEISYEVVGNEGLKIASSPTINFIIAVLKLIFNPKDEVNRTIMNFDYQVGSKKLSEEEAVRHSIDNEENDTAKSSIFSEEENLCIEEISRLPLYEAIEKLIHVFKLAEWHNETVFIQAFQDLVFKFTNSSNADLNSFLTWWEENKDEKFIETPENENAFKVMTIHKAKGLDFKVVIIPFCNWNLDAHYTTSPLLWCDTAVAPFNELPLMPVKYSSILKNSIFRNEYFDEQMHQYVDNLNLAYVAFTRARNEMYCFCTLPKLNAKKELPLSTISDLLYHSALEIPDFEIISDGVNESITIGKHDEYKYSDKLPAGIQKNLNTYPITDSSNRLKIRHVSSDYWKTIPISESRVNYGIIMHEILQKTIRKGDEEKAVAEQISAGRITEADLPEISREFNRFWSLPEVKEWFEESNEVLNENAILLPSGELYRPDRVVLQGNKATVIDYKFGEDESSSHVYQLRRYADFLNEMGYKEVKVRLYYVSLGKIISIENETN